MIETMIYSYALIFFLGFFLSGTALPLEDVKKHLNTIEMNAKAIKLGDRKDAIKLYLSEMWKSTVILSESGYFKEPQLGQLFKIRGFISESDDINRGIRKFGDIPLQMTKIIDLVNEIREFTNASDRIHKTTTTPTTHVDPTILKPTSPILKPTEPPRRQVSIWNPLRKLWHWISNWFVEEIYSL